MAQQGPRTESIQLATRAHHFSQTRTVPIRVPEIVNGPPTQAVALRGTFAVSPWARWQVRAMPSNCQAMPRTSHGSLADVEVATVDARAVIVAALEDSLVEHVAHPLHLRAQVLDVVRVGYCPH